MHVVQQVTHIFYVTNFNFASLSGRLAYLQGLQCATAPGTAVLLKAAY